MISNPPHHFNLSPIPTLKINKKFILIFFIKLKLILNLSCYFEKRKGLKIEDPLDALFKFISFQTSSFEIRKPIAILIRVIERGIVIRNSWTVDDQSNGIGALSGLN